MCGGRRKHVDWYQLRQHRVSLLRVHVSLPGQQACWRTSFSLCMYMLLLISLVDDKSHRIWVRVSGVQCCLPRCSKFLGMACPLRHRPLHLYLQEDSVPGHI